MVPLDRPSVLMVTENYLPHVGGTERQLALLASELRAREIRTKVVTKRQSRCWPGEEEISGLLVHRISCPKVKWLGLLVLLTRLGALLLTVGRRFDVFHVHTVSSMAAMTVLVGRLLGRPVVLKAVGRWELEEGVLNPARRQRLVYRWLLAVLRRADVWVAVSEELRQAMRDAGVPDERIEVIPNGVDTKHFTPRTRTHPENGLHVVYVGRLASEKGLTVLFEAWPRVLQQFPNAILEVVGSGPLEGELQALASRLGVEASVRFYREQASVLPFLQAAALFVLPSYAEGLSNALLEAMAVGLPAVATRVGGSEELIEDGVTGKLVPPRDAHALAEAMKDLLNDRERARTIGERARQRIVERCSLERVAHDYIRLYRRLSRNGADPCAASLDS